MPEQRFSLKDHLFNADKVSYLAGLFEHADHGFERSRFESAVMASLGDLELKERITHIATVLEDFLPGEFPRAAESIQGMLPAPLDPTLGDGDFGDFIFMPLGEFVARNGLASEHIDIAMALLREITMRVSMEGPIRPFLDAHPDRVMSYLREWAMDPNYHVRRLVSEGTRPLLPWAPRIRLDVEVPIPLLDVLHSDQTRYVTRSVSNHLNDISKIEPDLVFEALRRWERLGSQGPEELEWMTRHALRTLIKKGDPGAMELLGFSPSPRVQVERVEFDVPDRVFRIGSQLAFSIVISATHDEELLVDYEIDFVGQGGKRRSKVYKLKQVEIKSGDDIVLAKKHRLPASATTYSLNPGTHVLTVLVNGNRMASEEFELIS